MVGVSVTVGVKEKVLVKVMVEVYQMPIGVEV
jgi:hypothetical protein